MQSDEMGLVRYGLVAHDDGSDRMEPVARGQWVRADEAAAAIERLVAERDAALLNERVCIARLETLTTCGLAEVALSNATVMRQWGELTAERDEAREAWQKAETASLLSDEAIQYASVTLGGPDEWSDQETMIFSIRATAEAAEAQRDKLKEALKPFADFAENVDENGWNCGLHRESISEWFGPSDFRRARQALGDT